MPLTYPVDLNARYDIWDTNTSAFATRIKDDVESQVVNVRWPMVDGGPIPNLDPSLVPLLRVLLPDQAYDPATHKIGSLLPPVIDLVEQTSSYQRSVVALTQGELDAIAAATADNDEKAQLQTALAVFDSRTATNAQVQRAIAWLLRRYADGA